MNKQLKRRLSAILSVSLLLTGLSIGGLPTATVDAAQLPMQSLRQADSATLPLTGGAEIVPGQVIVKFKQAPQLRPNLYHAEALASTGGAEIYSLKFSENISVTEKMEELKSNPNVEFVEPVYKVKLTDDIPAKTVTQSVYFDDNHPDYMKNWGKTVTELTYADAQTTPEQKAKVTVAVIDSGIDLTHPDLRDSLVPGYNFINNTDVPQDDNGHGTHVSGIIAARAHDATGHDGVAPGVKLMPIKVMDSEGWGDTATIIKGIQFAIDHHADIINMSLGTTIPSRALQFAVRHALNDHILVVAAAGNESNHWINGEIGQLDDSSQDVHRYANYDDYPADFEEVLSVGAIEQLSDSRLAIADFSNVGKVDVVAPGVNIYSTFLNGEYKYGSGTSQAAPFVSGYAALLKAYNPELTVDDLKTIIKESAGGALVDPGHENDYENFKPSDGEHVSIEMDYGRGLINGESAFRLPRLKITPLTYSFNSTRSVTMDVYMLDLNGDVRPVNLLVNLGLYQDMEDSSERSKDALKASVAPLALTAGHAKATITLPPSEPFDVYHYYIRGEWTDSAEVTRHSNPIDEFHRPGEPRATIASGTYTGTQNVTLYSTDSDADIIFILIGNSGVHVGHFVAGQPIPVQEDSFLYALARKNHVYSDGTEFFYTIKPEPPAPPVYGGFGGGGCCAAAAPAPSDASQVVTDSAGGKSLVVTPDTDKLLQKIADNSGPVVIDATSKEKIDSLSIRLTGEAIRKASDKGVALVIKGDAVQISLPAGSVPADSDTTKWQLDVAASANGNAPADARFASPVFNFGLTVDGKSVSVFDRPVQVTFRYDAAQIRDREKAGVYTYDEASHRWVYAGGAFDEDGKVAVTLPHFSRYAVMEVDKTFGDIQGHWAQRPIEIMAARQIVEGMSDSIFDPEAKVTRAQFTALLTRSLNLSPAGDKAVFTDVPNDAWFKDPVYAAWHARIVSGVAEDQFAPNEEITREQMASMLVNAYLYAHEKTLADVATTQEVKFTDEGAISSWARANVRLAASLGLMDGADNGAFQPSESATRAQAATVIYRLTTMAESKTN